MRTHRYFTTGLGLTVVLLILLACAPPAPTVPTSTTILTSPAVTPTVPPSPRPSVTTIAHSPAPPLPSPSAPLLLSTRTPSPSPTAPGLLSTRTPSPVTPLSQTYADPNGFWSIRYPAGWTVRQSRSETQFRPTADSSAFLGVSLQIKIRAVEPLVGSILELLRSRAADFQLIEQGMTPRGWAPSARATYRRTVDGIEQRGVLVCWARYRIGYVALAEGPTADFAAVQSSFEAMIASFQATDFPDVIPYEKWQVRLSELDHLNFHYPPDSPAERDIERVDRLYNTAYTENASLLGITLKQPVDVYLYPTTDMRYHMTARDAGFAMVPEYEVHSLWAEDEQQTPGHEVVHVLTGNGWGEASEALLGEGIAVWLDHSGRDHHREAADLLDSGKLLPIRDLLGDGWFQQDGAITYPEAGSFVGYMLESAFGVSKLKRLYLAQDFEAELQAAVGWNLTDLEAAWHDYLRKY